MDIIAIAVALKKAISQTKDIITSHFVAGTNIEITDNPDGTQTINASGEVSTTDEVARQAISDHKANLNNPHSVTKNQIGLGNVDNTSDADKPISTATQTALNGKQDALTFDSTPTSESTNPVTSDGVYTALEEKLDILPFSSLIKFGMPEVKSETGQKGYVTLNHLRVKDEANKKIAFVINSVSNDINLSIARTGVLIYKLDATRQVSDVNADNMIVENEETLGLIDDGRNSESIYSPNVSNNIDGVPYGFVLRPYVKFSDDSYIYGDMITTSYTEVATKYPDYTISSLPVQAATGISFTMRWNIDDTKTISEMGMIYASGEYDRIDSSTPNTTTIPVPALCNHGICSNIIADNGDGVSMVGYCIVDGVTYYTDTVTGYYNELVKLSLGSNYLELKSGQREYLDTTVPTGNVPTGSAGMGFDEGVFTYKSGTKVSEGEPTANEFTGDISQFDNQGGTGSTYEYFKLTGDYTITLTCKDDCSAPTGITIGINADGGVATGGYTTLVAQRGNYTQGQVIIGKTSDNGYQYVYIYGGSTSLEWIVEHFDIMLNKGNTALPYEPYGAKKFPFYANGQSLADYTIYGNDGGVGDRTANLFDKSATVDTTTLSWAAIYTVSGLDTSKSYTLSTNYVRPSNVQAASLYLATSTSVSSSADGVWSGLSKTKQPNEDGTLLVIIRMNQGYTDAQPIYNDVLNGTVLVMLNEGSTALPYEPYGYKIPVGCGGQTTNIYIDSPLGDGDSIDYTTSQVDIPTVDGANSLICDTTVQPSKVSLTYTGWHSDLDNATARIEALENAPAPSGMTYDTLYEGTTASSYPYPLSQSIINYKFIIIAVGYSGMYTNAVVPVAVWSTVTSGGGNYNITVDTAQLRVNASEIVPRSANNRIVYGIYGIK